jgi:hypothetical protein
MRDYFTPGMANIIVFVCAEIMIASLMHSNRYLVSQQNEDKAT